MRGQGRRHWLFSWANGNENEMLNLNFGYQITAESQWTLRRNPQWEGVSIDSKNVINQLIY